MAKKHLIMEKAMELFAENGFESTSIQQITEACGISKGAFYLHFKSKDDLITNIIDHFMGSLITEIERSVSNTRATEQLLYQYVSISFTHFQKRADFAKLFLKEPIFSFNKELLERMQGYMSALNHILFSIIERQFPKTKPDMQLDLLLTISGLLKSYSELFLMDNVQIDVDQLCRSVIEKATLIAEHATIPANTIHGFPTSWLRFDCSKEELLKKIDKALQETKEDSIVHESLSLLRENMVNPTMPDAIVQGLLHNIRTNPHCHWIAWCLAPPEI